MLVQITPMDIPQEYKDIIAMKEDKELIDIWKKAFEKAKSFKKDTKEYVFYVNVANYVYKEHLKIAPQFKETN